MEQLHGGHNTTNWSEMEINNEYQQRKASFTYLVRILNIIYFMLLFSNNVSNLFSIILCFFKYYHQIKESKI